MRPALQRLLASPSALRLLRHCLHSDGAPHHEILCAAGRRHLRTSAIPHALDGEERTQLYVPLRPSERHAVKETSRTQGSSETKKLSDGGSRVEELEKRRESHGVEKSQERFPVRAADDGKVLTFQHRWHVLKEEQDVAGWYKVLEILRDRRRREGIRGAKDACRKIMDRGHNLPTEGPVAIELWDHFIQIGHRDPSFLSEVASYAVTLQERTGRARHGVYSAIVGHELGRTKYSAIASHEFLKDRIPPTSYDYERLFRLALLSGGDTLLTFEEIYKTHPVPNMYSTIIPGLCRAGLRIEATAWHYLLLEKGDRPRSFHACQPLIEYYSHVRRDKEMEQLLRSLARSQVWLEKPIDQLVRGGIFANREIWNKIIAETHGIAPNRLSDDFCGRLFATKFFSVDVVITALAAMGAESIGPSSLRELVMRDDCSCSKVSYHLDKLREAGMPPDHCKFNRMVRDAAVGGQWRFLRSIVECDLHPDTFDDINLQERLLVSYWDKGDHDQIDRTIAILESGIPEDRLNANRENVLLRCHISLNNERRVVSALEKMQRLRIPLAPRSSKHLRTLYLSERRHGGRPKESHKDNGKLTLIINVMKMTMEAGFSVPIEAWRELLKRLGLMGLLDQYQNLALWLVDWYTAPRLSSSDLLVPQTSALRRSDTPPLETDNETSLASLVPSEIPTSDEISALRSNEETLERSLEPSEPETPVQSPSPLAAVGNAMRWQNSDLRALFNVAHVQGVVAWGFQQDIKNKPNLHHTRGGRHIYHRSSWLWGVKLVKELQDRGVPIEKRTVARACKLRLAQLFNDTVVSDRKVNRRHKQLNNARASLMAKYRCSAYVEQMEKVWGRRLFFIRGERVVTAPISRRCLNKRKWRIIQHDQIR